MSDWSFRMSLTVLGGLLRWVNISLQLSGLRRKLWWLARLIAVDDTSGLALAFFFSHQGRQQLHRLRMPLPIFQIKNLGLATDETYKCSLRLLSVVKTVARTPRKSCGMYDDYHWIESLVELVSRLWWSKSWSQKQQGLVVIDVGGWTLQWNRVLDVDSLRAPSTIR